jgi:glycosyltransferase involved in cell wall biosynthesis
LTQPLHIGYDAKRAFFNHTGLGHYSRNLLQALAHYYPNNQYHLYSPKAPNNSTEPFLTQPPFVAHYPSGWIDKLFPSIWRSALLGSQLAMDGMHLYHGLSGELPLDILESKVLSVVTIHDLIFLDYPQLYPKIDCHIYRTKSSMACERADRIIAISEQTKQAIIRHFGIRESKIDLVYQSCNPIYLEPTTPAQQAAIKNKYQLPSQYLLYVGSIAERKQTLQLIEAFKLVNNPGLKLVLVGNGGEYLTKVQQYVKANQLSDKVVFLKNIPTEDLPSIYSQAQAFVYPSLMEGFGIPIIEALHSGTPVITIGGGCLQEAAGPGAAYTIDSKPENIARAIEKLLADPELRQGMAAEGYAHVQQFTPKTFADGIMEVYRKVLF